MSRTSKLREGGYRERGGAGGGAPFVKWPDDYAFLEGKVIEVWTGKYGDTAKMSISAVHGNVLAKGKTEDGEEYKEAVQVGDEVNVGLASAALEDTIFKEDKGLSFHIAFEGWVEPEGAGNRYRDFAVIELTPEDERTEDRAEKAGMATGAAPPHSDDEVPF